MPTTFGGQTVVAPQVVSSLDDSALQASGIAASSVVAVVGPSTGGKPNTALAFTSISDAITTLRTGTLLDVMRRVFDPGAGNSGAAKVIAVRVTNGGTPALRSTRTLLDGAAVSAVVLTSVDYGVWNNQIRVKVAAGTNQGLKLTTAAPIAGVVQNVINDNVYRALMSIQYTGAGSAATVTITATQLTTTATGAAGDNQTLTFAANPTIQTLVDSLNASGVYAAAVLGLGTEVSTTLDGISPSADIKPLALTFTANLQAVIDTFNGGPFVTAARSTSLVQPAVVGFTYFTGGTDGAAIVNADWTTAMAVLEPEVVGIVSLATDIAAIHAAAATHVTTMSNAKRERIAVLGGTTGETVTQTITRATNLGNDRVSIVYPGLQDADSVTGVLTTYPPYVTAGAVAGLLSGGKVQQAATFRYIGPLAMEIRLKDSDVDALITGGVIPVQNVTGKGNRVVQSVTTNTVTKNYVHNEVSVRRAADVVLSTVRDACEPVVATTTGPEVVGLVFSNVESALNTLFTQRILVGTKGSATPPYKNITVGITGNVVNITFQAQVGVPANYILIVAHLSPFSS
jgi:hypothetical protein